MTRTKKPSKKLTNKQKLNRIRQAVLETTLDGADYSITEGALESIMEILGITEKQQKAFEKRFLKELEDFHKQQERKSHKQQKEK